MKLINEKNFEGKTFEIPADGKIFTGGEKVTLRRIPESDTSSIRKKATTYKAGRGGQSENFDAEKFNVLAVGLVENAIVGWENFNDASGAAMECVPKNVKAVLAQLGKHTLSTGDLFETWLYLTASTISNFIDDDPEEKN